MAREYAPWIALAYAIIGREDQAEEIMGDVRVRCGRGALRYGPREQAL